MKPEARTRAGLRVAVAGECVDSCGFWHGVFDARGGINRSSEEDLFTDAVGQRGRQYQRSRAPVRVLRTEAIAWLRIGTCRARRAAP